MKLRSGDWHQSSSSSATHLTATDSTPFAGGILILYLSSICKFTTSSFVCYTHLSLYISGSFRLLASERLLHRHSLTPLCLLSSPSHQERHHVLALTLSLLSLFLVTFYQRTPHRLAPCRASTTLILGSTLPPRALALLATSVPLARCLALFPSPLKLAIPLRSQPREAPSVMLRSTCTI